MDQNKVLDLSSHLLDCSRFGGRRCAVSCVHLDRYRVCRRHCASLRDHLGINPGFMEDVNTYYKNKDLIKSTHLPLLLKHEYTGKYLPDAKLACTYCDFIAKSERGLKIHLKRSHSKPAVNTTAATTLVE